MNKAVVLLSGGIDSATCLALAAEHYSEIKPVFIKYGQQTENLERSMAVNQAAHIRKEFSADILGVEEIDARPVVSHFSGGVASDKDSFVTADGSLTEDDGRSTGYQPMRNLFLLTVASGIADTRDADAIYHGAQNGDEADYPDCRPEFMTSASQAINQSLSDDREIMIATPLINLEKYEVIQLANDLGVNFEYTYSCYSEVDDPSDPEPCGKCPACAERAESFVEAGVKDPYATELKL